MADHLESLTQVCALCQTAQICALPLIGYALPLIGSGVHDYACACAAPLFMCMFVGFV